MNHSASNQGFAGRRESSFSTERQQVSFAADGAEMWLRAVLSQKDYRRLLILSSPSAGRSVADRFLSDERILQACDYRIYTGVRENAPINDSEDLVASLDGWYPDLILAVGGGSVSDTAKAMAILLAEGGGLEEHCTSFAPPNRLHMPVLRRDKIDISALPTTLSAAEVTPGGGAINAERTKRTFWDRKVAATYVLYEGAALASAPQDVTISTGMNALAHCAEATYSLGSNPYSTALALHATSLLAASLTAIYRGHGPSAESYRDAGKGAALSGLAISNARVCLHHAICHALAGISGVAHGVANSILLPHVLRFNYPASTMEQAKFADAIAAGCPDVQNAVVGEARPWNAVTQLRSALDAPSNLSAVGVDRADLPEIAANVLQDRGLYFNPRSPDGAEIEEILEAAW